MVSVIKGDDEVMRAGLRTDHMPLVVDCVWSNIGQVFIAEAHNEKTGLSVASGRGDTRPDALRELADELERIG